MSMRPTLVLAVACLLLACSGPQPIADQPERRDLPQLDGRPVLDVPLSQAPEPVRQIWDAATSLTADRGPRITSALTVEAYRSWISERWAPWLNARVERVQHLRAQLDGLAEGTAAQRLFAAVVGARVYEDFARIIESMPLPEGLADDRELAATFHAELRTQAAPAHRRAAELWTRCIEQVQAAPEAMRSWRTECARRLALVPSTPAQETAAGGQPMVVPPECEARPRVGREPEQQRPTGNRLIALLPDGSGVLGLGEMDQLTDAVARELRRRQRTIRIVAARELAEARRLVAQLSRRAGNTCARAPRLVDVLRARHPDLVVGELLAACHIHGQSGESCALQVHLGRQADGSPWTLSTSLPAETAELGPFLAAVLQLADGMAVSGLVGMTQDEPPPGGAALLHVNTHGAWGELRPAAAIEPLRPALAACRSIGRPPPSDISAVLVVAPDGTVTEVFLDGGPSGAERLACVDAALRQLRLPESPGPRRLSFDVRFLPDEVPDVDYRVVGTEEAPDALLADEALRDWFLRAAVGRCIAGRSDAARQMLSFRAHLFIGPDGGVTDSSVEGVTAPPDDALSTCIDDALRGARFSCSADGGESELEVVLCVGGS